MNIQERDPGAIANYHHPCFTFKKGRQGLFPADHCIKINGYRGRNSMFLLYCNLADNSSKTMIIRTCALDSGTLTADTGKLILKYLLKRDIISEIVRISHCGHFKYEGLHYTGCVQSCDTDGCNAAVSLAVWTPFALFLLLL